MHSGRGICPQYSTQANHGSTRLKPIKDVHNCAHSCRQVHHKKKLEERLAEVEQAMRIFSQRRVLVKSDDAA